MKHFVFVAVERAPAVWTRPSPVVAVDQTFPQALQLDGFGATRQPHQDFLPRADDADPGLILHPEQRSQAGVESGKAGVPAFPILGAVDRRRWYHPWWRSRWWSDGRGRGGSSGRSPRRHRVIGPARGRASDERGRGGRLAPKRTKHGPHPGEVGDSIALLIGKHPNDFAVRQRARWRGLVKWILSGGQQSCRRCDRWAEAHPTTHHHRLRHDGWSVADPGRLYQAVRTWDGC